MTLPREFEEYTRTLMGASLYETLCHALAEEPPVSIRLNPFKLKVQAAAQALPAGTVRIPWCEEGYYLPGRPNFTFDPCLHAGLYYVQEASSMFVAHVIRQLVREPVMMLDLCAAPGGKTITARTAIPDGSLLFTNEPMKLRASILSENVQKFGHPDVIVTNNYPRDYHKSALIFDVIIADVPCSGEGMFRKDEEAVKEWSAQNVEKCRQLQRAIVEDIWPCLREGGLLIYSTCTFNAHENEENANWIAETLGADFVSIETQPEWGITPSLIDSNPVCRFIPGKTRGEGLFVAVLRKHGEGESVLARSVTKGGKSEKKRHSDKKASTASPISTDQISQWLNGDFIAAEHKEKLVALPKQWRPYYEQAMQHLHVIHAGVGLGTVKGRALIPDASLAFSTALRFSAFPHVEVNHRDAINFLRKEAVALPFDAPRGPVLLTYFGHPLGFVKNIGNRANNLYPQEWKIKSTHLPEQTPIIISNQ